MMAYRAQWPLGWRSPLAWLARDLALPVLWLAALVSDEFSWRGKTISPDDHPATARDREAGELKERVDAA
jgi:ceramide glucosyltransferase